MEHQIGIERIDRSSAVTTYRAFCSCGKLQGEPSEYETIAFLEGTEHLDNVGEEGGLK